MDKTESLHFPYWMRVSLGPETSGPPVGLPDRIIQEFKTFHGDLVQFDGYWQVSFDGLDDLAAFVLGSGLEARIHPSWWWSDQTCLELHPWQHPGEET